MVMPLHILVKSLIAPAPFAWLEQLITSWDKLLGPFAAYTLPKSVQKNTLTIGVYNSSVIQELYIQKQILLEKLSLISPDHTIGSIRLTLIAPKYKKSRSSRFLLRSSEIPLSHIDQKVLSLIQDPQLTKALVSYRSRCLYGE